MITLTSHTSGLFKTNSTLVYYKLEEATRTTTYAASIATLRKKKDSRTAFITLQSQYAGDDKWELEIKKQDNI